MPKWWATSWMTVTVISSSSSSRLVHHGPALVALGQGDAVVQPQERGQAGVVVVLLGEHLRIGLVLNEDDHVIHHLGQVLRDPVEGVADDVLEVLLRHPDRLRLPGAVRLLLLLVAHGHSLPDRPAPARQSSRAGIPPKTER